MSRQPMRNAKERLRLFLSECGRRAQVLRDSLRRLPNRIDPSSRFVSGFRYGYWEREARGLELLKEWLSPGQVAQYAAKPGMRHAPLDGDACAGQGVPPPVGNRDVERALQHDEMFLFLAVEVQRYAVMRIGHDFDEGIGPNRLRRANPDIEALSRRNLQPPAIVLIADCAKFGRFRYRHLLSPIRFCRSRMMDAPVPVCVDASL